jgi:TetR/AcrR family transcriptional regulator, mexJK operon transcriptional repressor
MGDHGVAPPGGSEALIGFGPVELDADVETLRRHRDDAELPAVLHFCGKVQLFAEIALATTDQVEGLVRLVSGSLSTTTDVPADLSELAGQFLTTLATQFASLSERGLLCADDPHLAAHHFVGLLLWIPINRAMFTGDETSDPSELRSYAGAATAAFLRAYSPGHDHVHTS